MGWLNRWVAMPSISAPRPTVPELSKSLVFYQNVNDCKIYFWSFTPMGTTSISLINHSTPMRLTPTKLFSFLLLLIQLRAVMYTSFRCSEPGPGEARASTHIYRGVRRNYGLAQMHLTLLSLFYLRAFVFMFCFWTVNFLLISWMDVDREDGTKIDFTYFI